MAFVPTANPDDPPPRQSMSAVGGCRFSNQTLESDQTAESIVGENLGRVGIGLVPLHPPARRCAAPATSARSFARVISSGTC